MRSSRPPIRMSSTTDLSNEPFAAHGVRDDAPDPREAQRLDSFAAVGIDDDHPGDEPRALVTRADDTHLDRIDAGLVDRHRALRA